MSVIHVLRSRLLDSDLDQWCSAFGNEKRKISRLTAIYVGMTRRIQDDAIFKEKRLEDGTSSFLLRLLAKGLVFRTVLEFLQL